MKKLFLSVLFLAALAMPSLAQEVPADPRYRDIKDLYDPRAYVYDFSDPYSPGWAGVASFVIPGLGQCICNEWGRGIGILAANVGFTTLEYLEASALFVGVLAGTPNPVSGLLPANIVVGPAMVAVSAGAAVVTLAGHVAFNIWNISDAVRIAKVKNMYYKDMSIVPSLALVPSGSTFRPAPGIGVRVTF